MSIRWKPHPRDVRRLRRDNFLDDHGCAWGQYNRGKIEDLWSLMKSTDRKVLAILVANITWLVTMFGLILTVVLWVASNPERVTAFLR